MSSNFDWATYWPGVRYWKFHDGTPEEMGVGAVKWIHEQPRGYTAWVYLSNLPEDFDSWMEGNMHGTYELDMKFNSGNPIYLLYIKEDADAAAFKLKFGEHIKEHG